MSRKQSKKQAQRFRKRQKRRLLRAKQLNFETLEERQLLTVTPITTVDGTTLDVDFELTYEPGQTVIDLDDLYLRTDASGNLEWSISANSGFTDIDADPLTTFTSVQIEVTYGAQSNEDTTLLFQNLFDDSGSTLTLQDVSAPGVDLEFRAIDVDVATGSVINTRDVAGANPDFFNDDSQGDSGDIKIFAPQIDVGTGAALLADVGNTAFAAGDITLEAIANLDDITSGLITVPFLPAEISITEGRATFDDATVRGNDVTITVESDSSDLFADEDTDGGVGEPLQEFIGQISVGVGVAISEATAEFSFADGEIRANNLTISADAAADAEATVLTAFGAIAYGQSVPTAKVDFTGDAVVDTQNDFVVTTKSSSDLGITATQNLTGTSTTVERYNLTIATAYSDVTSAATFGAGTDVTVRGDFFVDIDAERNHSVQSFAAAYGDGTLATGINVAVHDSKLDALIDGDVRVFGDMAVAADLETLKNDFSAQSTVGSTNLGAAAATFQKFGIRPGAILTSMTRGFNRVFKTGSALDAQSGVTKLDVSAAINVGVSFNDVEVRIGPGANVDVDGNLSLHGSASEFPETSAISFLNSANRRKAGNLTFSQRENGISAALTGGYFENEVDVYIGSSAVVDVGGDLSIESFARVPYELQFFVNEDGDLVENLLTASAYTDKLNYNLGIQNAFFTSWAEAISTAQQRAFGASLNILLTDTHNYAYIGNGAQVTVGGDLSVLAETENDTINFVGSPIGFFNATPGNGIGGAVMVTGYTNDTLARISAGTVITADSALVFANNRGRNISIGTQGGFSDNFGFNGAFTGRFVDNRTIAKVSEDAVLNLGAGSVTIPVRYDNVSENESSLRTSVAQFSPIEPYDSDDLSLLRLNESSDTIVLPYDHGLETGDAVIYGSDGVTDIGGITDGETYYAIVIDAQTLGLAATFDQALQNNRIPLTITTGLQGAHSLYPGFHPSSAGAVDTGANEINVGFDHGFFSGQPVRYSNGGGSDINGLSDGDIYYVVVTGAQSFKLADTSQNAIEADIAGDIDSIVGLSGSGAGRGHSFLPQAYTNLAVEDPLLSLDTTGDGRLRTDDEHIVAFNRAIGAASGGVVSPDIESIQTDLNFLVLAEDNSDFYSGTGAVTKTISSGAGVAVAVDVISRTTEAFVGAEEYALGEFAPGVGVDSADRIVPGYAHGFTAGDELVYSGGGDFTIGGLTDRGLYYVTDADTNSFSIGRSASEGMATFSPSAINTLPNALTINLGYVHGFHQGDAVVYSKGDAANVEISGLEDGQTYFVIVVDEQTIALAENLDDALSSDDIYFAPFNAVVDDEQIYLGYAHGLAEGTPLRYSNGGGSSVGGLTDGEVYFVQLIADEENALKLEDADGNVVELALTSTSGGVHSFHRGFVPTDSVTPAIASAPALTENTVDFGFEHGLFTGDKVRYDAAGDNSGFGLNDGEVLYAIVLDGETIAFAASEAEAEAGRERFFLGSRLLDNGDATDATKFDTIDLYTQHGYEEGDELLYFQGDSPDVGLVDGETYFVRLLDPNTTALEDSDTKLQLEDAQGNLVELTAGGDDDSDYGTLVNLDVRAALTTPSDAPNFITQDFRLELDTTSSTGTNHSIRLALDPTTTSKNTHGFGIGFDPSTALSDSDADDNQDTINLGYTHNFTTGQAVLYSAGEGEPITGLNEGQVYYVVDVDATSIQLAETVEQALSDDPELVKLNGENSTGAKHTVVAALRPNPVVDGSSGVIDFGRQHGLVTGDQLTYFNDDDTATDIGGLVRGTTYSVIKIDGRQIQLAATTAPSTPLTIDPTTATGTSHRFGEAGGVADGSITAGGNASLLATNTGEIISVTVAGVISTPAGNGRFSSITGASQISWKNGDPNGGDPVAGTPRKTGGLNVSGTIVVSAIVDQTRAYFEDVDFDGGGDLELRALNDTRIYQGAGSVVYATVTAGNGSQGLAGSLSVNFITNTTEAYIEDSAVDVAGDVVVDAENNATIVGVGFSGSGAAGSLSLAGAAVVNVLALKTSAEIENSTLIAGQNVDVSANTTGFLAAGAGGVAATLAGSQVASSTSVGAAIAINVIANGLGDQGTIARVRDSDIEAGGSVNIAAATTSTIWAVAVGLAFNTAGSAQTANAIGLSLSTNVISTQTKAVVRRKKNQGILAGGDVTITADDDSSISSIAGAGAIATASTSNSVGASIAINVISSDIRAQVIDTTIDGASLAVDAAAKDAEIRSLGVAGAVANSVAVAAQLSLNIILLEIDASIENSAVLASGTGGDVSVTATNDAIIQSLSGSAAVAGGNSGEAIGAALSLNLIVATAGAFIDNSSVTAADGSVFVDADSTNRIDTISVGVATAQQNGLAGSAVVSLIVTSTQAYITGSAVDADRNLLVHADQDADITSIGGAVGASATATGVGGALTVNLITNDTNAYIEQSSVHARANDAETIPVPVWDDQANQSNETRSGLAVIASSTQGLELLSGSLGTSLGGSAGIGVNLTPSFLFDTTHAAIDNTSVNESADTGGDVIVRAHQDTDLATLVGAAGFSLAGNGVGLAAQGIFVQNDTQASLSDSDLTEATGSGRAAIYSGGDVDVSTATREKKNTVVVGLAASALFAGAGSVDYTSFDNTNRAEISEVDVFADGDLTVTATDYLTTFEAAGGVNIGLNQTAAGGSFAVVENSNVTEALMTSAHTNAKGKTEVEAKSEADIDTGAIMLGGSIAISFQGSFVFYNSSTDTRAIIEGGGTRGASVNANPSFDTAGQSVRVYAEDDTTVSHLLGAAVGSASGGVAGALSIQDIQNTVDAHIGSESQVSVAGSLTVEALSEKDLFAGAGGLSVAGGASLSGSIIVIGLGTGLSAAGSGEITAEAVEAINDALESSFDGTGLSDSRTPLDVRDQLAATTVSVDPVGSTNRSVEDVAAFIDEGADIFVGGNLTVDAKEIVDVNSGSGAAALGSTAAGAAISILDIDTQTEAFIAGDSIEPDGSTIAVGGTLTVQSTATEQADVTSLAGAGGFAFGLGVQYSEIDADSSQRAFIGAGAQVLLAEQVNVLASHDRDFDSNATGGAASATVAAGVSAAKVFAGGEVKAEVGPNVLLGETNLTGEVVGTIGGLNVNATSNVSNADSVANAAAGGILLGVIGNISDTEVNPNVQATVNTGAKIYADDKVTVTAQTDQNADAGGFGLALGGSLSAGATFADANIAPSLTTTVGDSAEIVANEILIESLHNVTSAGEATGGEANVETTASSGSVLASASGTEATATGAANVAVQVSRATVTATSGDLTIQSLSHSQAVTKTNGNSGSIIGVGIQNASVDINTNNKLQVLDGAELRSQLGDVTLLAHSSEDVDLDAVAGSGGGVAISEARGFIDITHSTNIDIGAAAIQAADELTVTSSMDTFADTRTNAESFGLVAIPTSRATIDVRGSSGPDGGSATLLTELDGAELRGDVVKVSAEIERIETDALGRSKAFAIGTDADANARTNVSVAPEVVIGSGTEIIGGTSVDLLVDQDEINVNSDSLAIAEIQGDSLVSGLSSPFGDSDSNAFATVETFGRVRTAGEFDPAPDPGDVVPASEITTQVLTVQANGPRTLSISSDADQEQAIFDAGDSNGGVESQQFDREIDFNSKITLVTESPELEIGADGTIIAQSGITFTDDGTDGTIADGTTITVSDIDNTGSLAGEINLLIDADLSGSSSQIVGMPDVTFQNGFNEVNITNRADLDLVLGDIDVINAAATTGNVINFSAGTDRSGFSFVPVVTPGATEINISAEQEVEVAGDVNNPFGVTSINAGGDITSATDADVILSETIHLAATGEIGLATAPLQTASQSGTSTLLTASGAGITINHAGGGLDLAEVAAAGAVEIAAQNSILDGNADDDTVAKISGSTIDLSAASGSIGTSAESIEIDTSATSAAVTASASGDIYLTELTDELTLSSIVSTGGDIGLTVTDSAGSGQNLVLLSGQSIVANTGSVTLNVGDDLTLVDGSTIEAGTFVLVTLDTPDADTLRGSTATFLGTLTVSTELEIQGGVDGDTINLAALDGSIPVEIKTFDGDDSIRLGTAAGKLDLIAAAVTVDAGDDAGDTLTLDDSGNTGARTALVLGDATVTDFDAALTGLSGTVNFAGVENFELLLGSNNDAVTVRSTPAGTLATLDLGAGRDIVNVGSTSGTLNDLAGSLTIEGAAGVDKVTVLNSGDTAANMGLLTSSALSGLGMGDPLTYSGVESLDITLGSGGDTFTVEGVGAEASVRLGGGDDTVTISGSIEDFNEDISLIGNSSDNDSLSLSFTQGAAFTLSPTTLTSTQATGEINYSGLSSITADLSDEPDFVTVTDTSSAIVFDTGGGADIVTIEKVSVSGSTFHLGDDADADQLTLRDATGDVTVTGDVLGVDILTVDRSLATSAVASGLLEDSASGVLSGVTAGDITFDEFATFNLLLGSGNDNLTIDAGVNLAGTDINVDTGLSTDTVTIVELSDDTSVDGNTGQDEVIVVVDSFPVANQFDALGVSVETLTVDNRQNTTGTAWALVDRELTADNGAAPTGNPIPVLSALGADVLSLLGGSGEDSLDVSTATLTDVSGSITGNRVDLEFGTVVLTPGTPQAFSQTQQSITFEGLVDGSTSYFEDELTLSTDGQFAANYRQGPAVTASTIGETFTLAAAGGGGFVFYGLSLASLDGTAQPVSFTATTLSGTEREITVEPTSSGLVDFTAEFASLTQVLRSISWTMDPNLLVDNIVAASRINTTIDFNTLPSSNTTDYREQGFRLTASQNFEGDEGALQLNPNNLGATEVRLRAVDNSPFSLHSIELQDLDFFLPGTVTLLARTVTGQDITRVATVGDENGPAVTNFTDFNDLRFVTFVVEGGTNFRIDDIEVSQGFIESVTASAMPTPVTESTVVDDQALVFNTGNLRNADTSDNLPTLTVNGAAVTSLNGVDFSVEYLDGNENVVANPQASATYLARYTFHGDFELTSGSVAVVGDHALSIIVENNARIGGGVTFNVAGEDASTTSVNNQTLTVGGAAGPGGGTGGSGGSGGDGQVGGEGRSGGRGGAGGDGGAGNQTDNGGVSFGGDDGAPGRDVFSRSVDDAEGGADGGAGSSGFNNSAGGSGGDLGAGGDSGFTSTTDGGEGGAAGTDTDTTEDPDNGEDGGRGEFIEALDGQGAGDGGDGLAGSVGTNGSGGTINLTSSTIAGGGGGGAGGGGGGGGAGAGGSGGAGGGGGGGGGGDLRRVFSPLGNDIRGADGAGGSGGSGGGGGGDGGSGGDGAEGGAGGGGGGAFELVALGELFIGEAAFIATGGDALIGQGGAGGSGGSGGGSGGVAGSGGEGGVVGDGTVNAAQNGSSGNPGSGASTLPGVAGDNGELGQGGEGGAGVAGGAGGLSEGGKDAGEGGDGGAGGRGGDGGAGGAGGSGGAGGQAGGGAGGTIKLSGSRLRLDSIGGLEAVDVQVAGGTGTDSTTSTQGDIGRVLIGNNDAAVQFVGTDFEEADRALERPSGPTLRNSYLIGGGSAVDKNTPYIPNLIGGAALFGFLDGIDLADVDFNLATTAIDAAPSDALVAVFRLDTGLGELGLGDHESAIELGDDFDQVLIVNLTDLNLALPKFRTQYNFGGSTLPLTFDGLTNTTGAPVEVTALNAGAIWTTIIAEDDSVRFTASIAADVENFSQQVIANNTAEYITTARPTEQSLSADDTLVDFAGIEQFIRSADGTELYAVASEREALLVVDADSLAIRQVIEAGVDGNDDFVDLRKVLATADGEFVYVQLGDNDLAIISRDTTTGVLSFDDVQTLPVGLDAVARSGAGSNPFASGEGTVKDFAYVDLDRSLFVHMELTEEQTGTTEEKIRHFRQDSATGRFDLVIEPNGDPDELISSSFDNGRLSRLDAPVAGLVALGSNSSLYILSSDDLLQFQGGLAINATATPAEIASLASLGITDPTGLIAAGDQLHVLSTTDDSIVTLEDNGILGISRVQAVTNRDNGVNGLAGLAGADSSIDGQFIFAIGQEDESLVALSADGSGVMQQRLRNNSSGVTGLISPVGVVAGADAQTVFVATLGDASNRGGIVPFRQAGGIGNNLTLHDTSDDSFDSLNILDQPFGGAESTITNWRFVPSDDSVDPFGTLAQVTPVLLENVGGDWRVTGVGTPRTVRAAAAGEFDEFDFGLVAGSDSTTDRYFGWVTRTGRDFRDPNLPNRFPGGISFTPSTDESVLQVDLSTLGTSGEGADGLLNDQFAVATVQAVGREYSVQVSIEVEQAADTVRAEFSGVESISVGTAGGEDVITLFEAPSSEVTSLSIRSGDQGDVIEVQDLTATTLIEAGGGDDTVSLRTDSDGAVTIEGEEGEDFLDLIGIGPNTITTLRGGADNDLIQIAGDELATTATTTVDGQAPSNVPTGDTLLFNPGDPNAPITQVGSAPAGSIGVTGQGAVDFTDIEDLQVIAAPTFTFPNGTLIEINEGDTLNATVVLASSANNNGVSLEWDIDGDGEYGEVSGTSISIEWDDLTDFGINNGPLMRDIAVRGTNSAGFTTTEEFTVVVSDTPPEVSVDGAETTTVGADFEIFFSSFDFSEVDAPTGWLVNWGDGSEQTLGSDVTSAVHNYAEPDDYVITVSVFDEDSGSAVADSETHDVTVLVATDSASAGGPYEISEGEGLTLLGTVIATPTSVAWDLNDDGVFGDAVGLSPTLTWSALVDLGVDNSGTDLPIAFRATYSNGQVIDATTTLDIFNVIPTATLTSDAPAGGVDEGSIDPVTVSFGNPADPSPADLAALTYSFDFGDDGTIDVGPQASPTATVPPALLEDSREVVVRGFVFDDEGQNEFLTRFNVNEVAPTIGLSGAGVAIEGQDYQLTVTTSDPGVGDTITGFYVDWGDGSDLEFFPDNASPFEHTFADNAAGATTITVFADDDDGRYEATLDVTVNNVAAALEGVAIADTAGTGTLIEGSTATLTGSITDPGVLDSFTLTITWGDGQQNVLNLPAGETNFEVIHRYDDDGDFDISLTLVDDDGEGDADATSMIAVNAAPELTIELDETSIDETGAAVLTGVISDLGVFDSHTVEINWGDGTIEPATVVGNTFVASHVYDDDNPTATFSDGYTITATATDANDITSTDTETIDLTVFNTDPVLVTGVTTAPDSANAALPGEVVTLSATFYDISPDDTFTAEILWGDGDTTTDATITFDPSTLQGTIEATHTYAADGDYNVEIRLTDDDTGNDSGNVVAVVATPTTGAPKVTEVLVSGSLAISPWSQAFKDQVDVSRDNGTGIGYSIPAGTAQQTQTLPWNNVNVLHIAFDQDVSGGIQQSDLRLFGINGPSGDGSALEYQFVDFAYNDATFVASWTLAAPVGPDKLVLQLSDTVNAGGIALDGESANGDPLDVDLPSGNDASGGDFLFRINTLPGDGNSDNSVSVTDLSNISFRVAQVVGDANYLAAFDINADGAISVTDLVNVSTRIRSALPDGEPAFPVPILAAPIISAVTASATQPIAALVSPEIIVTVPTTPVEQVSLARASQAESKNPATYAASLADAAIAAADEEPDVQEVTAELVDAVAAEQQELAAALGEIETRRNSRLRPYRPAAAQRSGYRPAAHSPIGQIKDEVDSSRAERKEVAVRIAAPRRTADKQAAVVDELLADDDSLDTLFDSVAFPRRNVVRRVR